MYMLVLRFQIPNSKLHEFNLALERLVKWPVYTLYNNHRNISHKVFELLRKWESKALMEKDLNSPEYENLMGAIKVLGEINESNIYKTKKVKAS
jgi:hypothetical protein